MRPLPRELWSVFRASRLSREQLDAMRDAKLRRMVRHAYERTPFYRERFRAAGVRPRDIRSIADLPLLPITTKEELQEAGIQRRLASGYRQEACRIRFTSGSTGRPLEIATSFWDGRMRSLVELRTMLQAGVKRRDHIVAVGPSRSKSPGLLQRLGFYRTEMISGLTPLDEQIQRLREIRPDVLWIYPGVVASLYEQGKCLRDYVRPRMLIFSGEVLQETVKQQLETDLGLTPLNFYGCFEAGRIAAECSAGDGLHINEDHVVVEILEQDSTEGGAGVGTVVLTNLQSWAMPFVRYRLGDLAAWRAGACGCGSQFRRIGPPVGRSEDLLVLPSGKAVPIHRCYFALRKFSSVKRFRIIQESETRLTVLFVSRAVARPASGEVKAALQAHLGEPMDIDIRFVEEIRDDGLKFRGFVSRIRGRGAAE